MIYPLLKVIKYFAIFIIPSKLFRKKSNKILDKAIQNESNSERYIPLYNFTKSNSQVIDLNKCVKKTFEGQEIEVQKNYEEYLIEKFGD
jgi:phosphorylcholine metabolism protein LicD